MTDPFGIALTIGTIANATFNAAMASTVEYDEKCRHVKDLDQHVSGVNAWCDAMNKAFQQETGKYETDINQLKSRLKTLKEIHKAAKKKYQIQLNRNNLAGKIFTSLVTLILTMKYLLRNF